MTEEDLKNLLKKKTKLHHYIGFEISGKVHVGSGLLVMKKVKDFVDAGVSPIIFLADWHTWINDKLGGNLKIIQRMARGYFTEAIKASFRCVGGDPEKLDFVLGSDLYAKEKDYWASVVKIADTITLSRAVRSITIMGRKETEDISLAKLFYPAMQVADIFALGCQIAQAGMDQRKVHVIARAVAEKLGYEKPVALHHHLLMGLESRDKMSKSKPESAVFIHDAPEEIEAKIKKAFCPPRETEFNPILDWTKHLIFPIKKELLLSRKVEYGGSVEYNDFAILEQDYKDGKLHPEDLKNAVAKSLIDILEPARKHFQSGKPKKMLKDLEKLMPE
ncbi:MAG: tyrosyl-tRNA synthetase [Parcubacteria group bacterium Gr01-1014_30]|nr:MAG: tyrosyl-tRNA synthetase [Parcubacteria group bacterium Gr01-1014_30]